MGGLPRIGDGLGYFYNVDEGFAATGVGCKSHEARFGNLGAHGGGCVIKPASWKSTRNGATGKPQTPTGRAAGQRAIGICVAAQCLRLAPQLILVVS
jgi:hypothetical protein